MANFGKVKCIESFFDQVIAGNWYNLTRPVENSGQYYYVDVGRGDNSGFAKRRFILEGALLTDPAANKNSCECGAWATGALPKSSTHARYCAEFSMFKPVEMTEIEKCKAGNKSIAASIIGKAVQAQINKALSSGQFKP